MDQDLLASPRNDGARWVRTVALMFAFAWASTVPSALRAQDGAADKPSAPGAYSAEQADRGNGIFGRTCVECHTRNDMSNADFRLKWNGRTVFDLFEQIRTTMPEASPGSMTPAEYADVTAYFLKLNGMVAGSTAMPADSTLRLVKIDIPASPPGATAAGDAMRPTRTVLHAVLFATPRARSPHSPITRRGS